MEADGLAGGRCLVHVALDIQLEIYSEAREGAVKWLSGVLADMDFLYDPAVLLLLSFLLVLFGYLESGVKLW